MRASRPRYGTLLLLAGLLLVAFALRLFRLDAQSIWWDEGISLHLATSSLAEIVRDRLNNIHPPLYFFVLKGWLALVGVSAFTGRYLSALASMAQVALIYAAARRWRGRDAPVAWLAAALILLSPLFVIYGQEIRVYAMLPVVYLVMLLLTGKLLVKRKLETRSLVCLGLTMWLALHLHYVAVFAVGYVSLWGLAALYPRRDWAGLRRWVIMLAAVALASLPWVVAVIGNWASVQAEANAGTFTTEPVPLPYLFAQVWAFHLTGLAGALSSRFVQIVALAAGVLMVGLLVARSRIDGGPNARVERAAIWRTALHWLVPLTAGLAFWSVRSFSHPRYIIMFAALFIPLAAFLIHPARRWADRAAGWALLACLVALSLWGLGRYFFDPHAAKPDVRGAAMYLKSVAAPGDLVLIPDTDWSLPFEYDGPAAVLMPRLDESPHDPASALAGALTCSSDPCAESGRVFVVDYPGGTRDWQGHLPFELERRGYWASQTAFDGVRVREYQLLDRLGPLPDCTDPSLARPAVRFGPLLLESAWVEQGAAADTAVAVALCWRLLEPATEQLAASLVLRDPVTGERIAQTDAALVDAVGAPTTDWSLDTPVLTYHLLPLPPGTPPVDAGLAVGVYGAGGEMPLIEATDAQGRPAGQLVALGDVELAPPLGVAHLYDTAAPPLWAEPVDVAPGLQLLGARFSPGPYRPGQTIRVGLTWRATGGLPDLRPALTLEQGGDTLAENADAPVNGRYPTERWQPSQIVFEYHDVRVPAGVAGAATLALRLDGRRIELGEVTIEGAPAAYERPAAEIPVEADFGDVARLIGVDPPGEIVSAAETIPITLYWQALSGEAENSYTVFVHLLAEDGRLIAQHDAPPANGGRPTNEWLPGEYVIDPHELTWREPNYTGPARFAVGLYDPLTGERLRTADGADSLILPLTFTVTPD